MKTRSPLQTLAASPTMVGAVTTLIVIVAVFLAYNANNGLPFVPVYRVSAVIPESPRLVKNNEVRIGGHRVGVIESIDPIRVSRSQAASLSDASGVLGGATPQSANETCCVAAKLNLKLDKSASPLTKDSIFRVRYKSSFGLKYLEITRGTGPAAPQGYVFDGLDDSGTCELPVDPKTFAQTEPASARNGCFQPQTEFDAISNTFNTKTRTHARENLVGFGDAFAGRGASLNEAIGKLKPLFGNLKPVSEVLADPSTRLRNFFEALGRTSAIVAPVAVQQADFFTQAASAFDAISSDPAALQGTISEGVPLETQGIGQLRRQRPFLTEFAELSRRLRPGVRELRVAIPTLNDAITIGTPVLNSSVSTNHRLRGVMVELHKLVAQPSTKITLQRLKETFDQANPLIKWVGPAQTVCNYWNDDWNFFAEHLSERDQIGFLQRVQIVNMPRDQFVQTPLDAYSGKQANGLAGPIGDPQVGALPNEFAPHSLPIVHGNSYAPTGQPNSVIRNYASRLGLPGYQPNYHEAPDCQPGQTGYPLGFFPVPGQSMDNPGFALSNIPGSRGVSDVFFPSPNTRTFTDTRIPSHQP